MILHVTRIRYLARRGSVRVGWTLTEGSADGPALMIGHHGCVAPTRRAAVDAALALMASDDGYRGYVG